MICKNCGHEEKYHLPSLADNELERCIAENCTCPCPGFQPKDITSGPHPADAEH